MKNLLLLAMLWGLSLSSSWAQLNDGGSMPLSFTYGGFGLTMPTVVAPALDMERVRAEDAARAEKGELYTIGRIVPVNIDPKRGGEWQSLRNGDRIWRVRIQAKGAEGISLYFSQFNLPRGARMHAYSVDGQYVLGGFTSDNNHESGKMATAHVLGDDIIVEYYEPVYATGKGSFVIHEIGHGYKDVRDFGDSESCEVNVNCPEGTGRTNQRNAVARILVRVGASQGWCSGTLINNVRQNCTPYFISAEHCALSGSTFASTTDLNQWIFYFNYQGATCANPGTQPSTAQSMTGATFRARSNDAGGNTGSDMLLLQLNSSPPAAYNVFYAGWDRNNTATTGGYGIHHPAGDIKKISTFTATTSSTSWGGSTPNTHWGLSWVATASGHGVTEGGSSGSALFNSAGRMIGTLTGGGSSCSNRTAPDRYGKMSYHWQSNGTAADRRLSNWLDPDNTGATTLDGIAAPCSAGPDAGILDIQNPAAGSLLCVNPTAPIVTLRNYGSTTLTAATIRYRIDAGTINNFSWTGSLAVGASTTVTLPSTTFPTGAPFTFRAWTNSPNGLTDINIANDTAQAVSEVSIAVLPPYSEGFNAGSIPANIDILDPNADAFDWVYQAGVSAYGVGTGSMKFDNFSGTGAANPGGTLDWFILPTLDLSTHTNPQLTFDVAYGLYSAANSDTLIVAVSTNCSPNYAIAYLQGGSQLATRAGNTTVNFVPSTTEWVNKTVNLSAFAGQGQVSIAFINKSGWGNNVYVDNINLPSACAVTTSISSQANVACFGGTGSATIAASGGTAPYTFNRGTGNQSTGTFTGLTAGAYTITVTDNFGCTATRGVTVTQPAAALNATTSLNSNATCFGSSNGSATVSATGGTAPYTFIWSNASTTAMATGLAAGVYSVTPSDANGCTVVRAITITQPSAITTSISSQTNITGCGNTGAFTIAATGGTPSYTFNRGTGAQASGSFAGLAAGTYNVTVTDGAGCTAIRSVTITQSGSSPATSVSSQTNVSCFGGNTGSLTIGATGGTAPYTFNRGTGNQSTGLFTGLTAGTYSVTVTDNTGCVTVQSASISQPATALGSTTTSIASVACFGGSTGSFTVAASGGTAPYTFNRGTGAQSTGAFTGLAAGSYNVTITDNNSCTTTRSVTITQPVNAVTSSLGSLTNVSCSGGSNGSLTVNGSGGTAPYTYNRGTGSQSTGTFTGLMAGTYTVTVTDNAGCQTTRSATITQPSAITTSISSQTNITGCGNTGAFTIAATGGTPTYTFNRGTGAQASGSFTGLVAGTYNVSVTDAAGCVSIRPVTLTQSGTSPATAVSSQTNVSCNGGSNGAATIGATGGTAPYTFNRGTGAQSTGTFSGLAAGTYTVTVTDNGGCVTTQGVTITQPSAITATTASTHVVCFGESTGSITVSASGGTAPYTYNRGTGAQSNSTFSSMAAGTYTITVTDNNGCAVVRTATVVQASSPLVATLGATNTVSCFGGTNGSATINATGGVPPYIFTRGTVMQSTGTFTGLTAGTHLLEASDAYGCSVTVVATVTQPAAALTAAISAQGNVSCLGGSNGSLTVSASGGTPSYLYNRGTGIQVGNSFAGLAAGNYVITVSDANGCQTTVNATISQPLSALSLNVSTTATTCAGNDGTAAAIATGGGTPYQFIWSNSATGNAISALGTGTIIVTVTDNNGCQVSASGLVANGCAASCSVTISSQLNNLSCFGVCNGSITATPANGTAPYSFLWSNGGGNSATNSGLCAGVYSVTVTDNAACVSTATFNLSQPATALSASVVTSSSNSLSVNAAGGTQPYSFLWSDGSSASTLQVVASGSYSATVTDANGCNVSTNAVSITITSVRATNGNFAQWSVYPNPTQGAFQVSIELAGASEGLSLQIVDVLGRQMHYAALADGERQFLLPVDLSAQASGVYFVILRDSVNGTQQTQKVVFARQ